MSQLNKIVRRVLILEAGSSNAAADAANGLITSTNDPTYRDAVTRFPPAKAHLDEMIAAFESSKAERVAYIRDEFPKRLKELRLSLYRRETGDSPKAKQLAQMSERDTRLQRAMLSRLEASKIAIPAYPKSIDQRGEFDNMAAWARITERFSVSKGSRGSLLGFAPIELPFVFVRSPSLTFNEEGRATGASVDPNILSVIKHELIHQEDHAASTFVLGKTSPSPDETEAAESSDAVLPTALSLELLENSLLSPSAVTQEMVYEVVKASSRLRSMVKDASNIPVLITKISDMLLRLLGKGYLYRQGQSIERREGSHARVYLTLIRPDLEAAIGYIKAESSDAENRADVIDRVLYRTNVDAMSVQLLSIVAILMVLDLDRIKDLLMVAKREQGGFDQDQSDRA
jgi:hypothetical protein